MNDMCLTIQLGTSEFDQQRANKACALLYVTSCGDRGCCLGKIERPAIVGRKWTVNASQGLDWTILAMPRDNLASTISEYS